MDQARCHSHPAGRLLGPGPLFESRWRGQDRAVGRRAGVDGSGRCPPWTPPGRSRYGTEPLPGCVRLAGVAWGFAAQGRRGPRSRSGRSRAGCSGQRRRAGIMADVRPAGPGTSGKSTGTVDYHRHEQDPDIVRIGPASPLSTSCSCSRRGPALYRSIGTGMSGQAPRSELLHLTVQDQANRRRRHRRGGAGSGGRRVPRGSGWRGQLPRGLRGHAGWPFAASASTSWPTSVPVRRSPPRRATALSRPHRSTTSRQCSTAACTAADTFASMVRSSAYRTSWRAAAAVGPAFPLTERRNVSQAHLSPSVGARRGQPPSSWRSRSIPGRRGPSRSWRAFPRGRSPAPTRLRRRR